MADIQGLSDLITASKNGNILLGQIIATLQKVFPQTLGTSSTASAGAATLPANPVGFLTVVNPATGATVKIAYYGN